MPYPPEHREETRKRIVACARSLFNSRGFSEVSIDEIMAAAGLTRGGFYHHFTSKEQLYVEAIMEYARNPPAPGWSGVDFDPSTAAPVFARQLIDAYLSQHHLRDTQNQCPMIALPSDIGRAGRSTRAAFEALLLGMATYISRGIGDDPRAQRTLAITALCVGGMVLARTVEDDTFAESIRQAARAAALRIAGLEDASAPEEEQEAPPPSKSP